MGIIKAGIALGLHLMSGRNPIPTIPTTIPLLLQPSIELGHVNPYQSIQIILEQHVHNYCQIAWYPIAIVNRSQLDAFANSAQQSALPRIRQRIEPFVGHVPVIQAHVYIYKNSIQERVRLPFKYFICENFTPLHVLRQIIQ